MNPSPDLTPANPVTPAPTRGVPAFTEQEVTILFADLRGYTAMGSTHDNRVLVEVLDGFLAAMSDRVLQHGGTVDKFMGDAVMAVFGAPRPLPDHVPRALACAAAMQHAMDAINATHRERGLPEVFAGIGIATGPVVAGWLGSPQHREYSVIGDAVNLASRIESLSLRGQVLIAESTFSRAAHLVEASGPTRVFLKGEPDPVNVYELLGIPASGLQITRRDARRSHRVRVRMPFSFQLLAGKVVLPEVHPGTVHDIAYQGVLAELDREVPDFADLRLSIDLTPMGYRAADVYGKVLHTKQRGGLRLSAIEFTSVTLQSDVSIRQFVQMLLQGYPQSP